MSILFSLIAIYLIQKYLGHYPLFINLQNNCTADWVDDLLFKFQLLVNNFPKVPVMGAALLLVIAVSVIMLLLNAICFYISYYFGIIIFNLLLLFYCLSSAKRKKCNSLFIAAFEQNFGLLFWFTILGSVGLVLFWLFSLYGNKTVYYKDLATDNNNHNSVDLADDGIQSIKLAQQMYSENTISHCLYIFHNILAWIPARAVGLVFSLIGDFNQGFKVWKQLITKPGMEHGEFVECCGIAALGKTDNDSIEGLLERTFVAWLILCIIISGLM